MTKKITTFGIICGLCIGIYGVCLAETYELPKSVVDQGGTGAAERSSSSYTLEDTSGQAVVGESSGASYDSLGIGYQYISNDPPTATGLIPQDITVQRSNPTLQWTYTDKDDDPQRKYHVQVSELGAAFGEVGQIDTGIVTSSEPSYTPVDLFDRDYKWRVRVHDGWGWSGWTAEVNFAVSVGVGPDPTIEPKNAAYLGDGSPENPIGFNTSSPRFDIVAPLEELITSVVYEISRIPEGTVIFTKRIDEEIPVERLSAAIPVEHLPFTNGFYIFHIVRIEYESERFAEDVPYYFFIDTAPPVFHCLPVEGAVLGVDEERPIISSIVEDLTGGINVEDLRMTITDVSHALGASVDEFLQYLEEERPLYTGTRGTVSYDEYSAATPFPGGFADGEVTVTVSVRDLVGNEGSKTWAFTVDTLPPQGSIVINQRFDGDEDGAPRTGSCQVTLSLAADGTGTNVVKVLISNREDFAGALEEDISFPEEIVDFQRPWSLEPIRGLRRVFVRFKDEANNLSPTYSDDIFLDILPPLVFITSRPPLVIEAEEAEVEFSFEASEDECRFKYRFDDEPWPAEWSLPPAKAGQTPPRLFAQGSHSFEVIAGKDMNEDGVIESSEESLTRSAHWIIHPEGIGPPVGPPEEPIKYWREE